MWIEKGKLLQVRLERAPRGAAFVRVVHGALERRSILGPRIRRVVTGIAPDSATTGLRFDALRRRSGAAPLYVVRNCALRMVISDWD